MSLFTTWKGKIEEYASLHISLFKLNLIERSAKLIGAMMLGFITMGLGLGVLAFIGYGLMQYFVQLLDSKIGGAFATAGIFLLIIIIVMLLRKSVINALASIFIDVLTDDTDEDVYDAAQSIRTQQRDKVDKA
ncbi:MAG: hypothetical protein ABI378_10525 [Chitinophagaceae bacterium]